MSVQTRRNFFRQNIGTAMLAAAGSVPGLVRAQAPAAPAEPEASEVDVLHPPPKIEWEKLAEMEPPPGFEKPFGLAGAFAGAHGDTLIIAGGTNFPTGAPWTGGKRAWWSHIHVLKRAITPENTWKYAWVPSGAELPESLAYGASVSLKDGLLCIGGTEFTKLSKRCFLLRWNETSQTVESVDYPELPRPLANCAAVKLGDAVYVLGGQERLPRGRGTTTFLMLDLTKAGTPDFVWKELPGWDGPGRVSPVATAFLEGDVSGIYLCGGRDPDGSPDFLSDLHRFVPKKGWSILGDIATPNSHPCAIMAAPGFHVPPHHMVIVSGSDEELIRFLEKNDREIDLRGHAWASRLCTFNQELMRDHPGYTPRMLAYDAASGEWTDLGDFPGEACLSTPVVNWDGSIIIPGGETGPGRRSGAIWQATIRKKAAAVSE